MNAPSGVRNHTLQRMLLLGVQPRLSVSMPGDELEREADRVAETFVTAGDRPTPGAALHRPVQRACAQCEEELQRKSAGGAPAQVDGSIESDVRALEGRGAAIPAPERSRFENRLGHDFSDVRIHTDPAAARTASAIGAQAYTHGRNVVFAPGQYQPATASGRKLLAHELAHVVQQRPASGAARAAGDSVQRACGPTDIGTPAGCTPLTSEPIGELVAFRVNCDEFASGAERRKVKDFADSMTSTDRVRVHGFASTDGDPTFNHNLSCSRARQAVAELTSNGISPGQIDTFEHGPTPGPADQRRSVVLELDAPISRLPTPQLTASVVTAPAAGDCGDVNYVIRWGINRNSHALNGGFVVQDITITRTDDDCSGAAIPWGHTSPLRYFEVWRVSPGSRNFDPLDGSTDTFGVQRPSAACVTGSSVFSGVATYFDNVSALPATMIRHNPATTAGNLRSDTADPSLAGVPSRSVRHRLSISWNCCPCSSTPTVIVANTP